MLSKIENIIYKKIIRSLMFTSWLGRRVITGHADSAVNFAHIYRNKSKGYNFWGKGVDRILLNLPSAKATRNRKENIAKIISAEIKNNIAHNKKTRIVDLASGPATYLIELIDRNNQDWVEVLCLDIDKRSLSLGKKLTVGKPFLFKRGNTKRLTPYIKASETIGWKPNLILASGLLFYYDDSFATKLFKELFGVLDSGGLFLFDNLIGNPNKKFLSKVGVTRSGKAWEFYYRKPAQIKTWLFNAGFTKIDYNIDRWNMYVLYKARKQNNKTV